MPLDYKTQITRHREEVNFFFKGHPQSPLTPEQKKSFTKLDYFPVNESFRYEVIIDKFKEKKSIEMQTSTGQIQHFIDYGTISFTVGTEKANLHIYINNSNPNHLFVPFWDLTVQTKETYGAGRYVDLEPHGDKYVLDFNTAYNPYCAYNEHWTCPLVPPPNRLKVRIEAGEKLFKDGH